ncbi:MAG TPA: alpha/beta hydrolase [Rhodanobacteraceae bacterium]|nr:alpha/beta hydrolase [Rhodanobacteraceae bacterium]
MNNMLLKAAFAVLAMLAWSTGYAQSANFPNGNVRIVANVAYGSNPLQTFNVYMPKTPTQNAPVILMVHGGGWFQGDKADTPVVQNKVKRWLPAGFIFISVNYPLMPQTNPLQQAQNVAQALAYAQQHAADWGGDPNKFILMGFSAGAHLVSLISAEPSMATSLGALPWLGTVALDSAAYDIPEIMAHSHPAVYDEAFGTNVDLWNAASPTLQLKSRIAPFMAVCTSQESHLSSQDLDFITKANGLGTQTRLLQVDLTHAEIDADLGLPSDYTNKVTSFIVALKNGVTQ